MKNIAIVTDGKNKLDAFLRDNISVIFEGYANINLYHINDLEKGDLINEDVVLVMIKDRVIPVKEILEDSQRIIVVDRTIKSKQAYEVFSIPENMEVLVVNDNYETSLQMVSLLYEIGINHLKLIPYDESAEYREIKTAITPGERNSVPHYIEEVIDLGNRVIDVSTLYKMISHLEIKDKTIMDRVIKYSDELISINSGIDEGIKKLIVKNHQLGTLIKLSKDGILHCSVDGTVNTYNPRFLEIMDLNEEDMPNLKMQDIFSGKLEFLIDLKSANDEVININSKYLNINKESLFYMGKKTGACYHIQEITYIKQLEQNLSKKLREKGQIARYNIEDIITHSESMIKCKNFAKKIAKTELTVLITGESGTGKELMAQSIHNASNRSNHGFIALNCAAMPDNLLESELFGYERGAFTGANKEGKRGLFEQANHGTIFLDEIGDMPLHLQTKLLRVLQERQVMRIGGESVIDIDVRVIAATNKDLLKMIDEEKFRDDLYYRLNVLPISIPSLNNRREDIIPLLEHFMRRKFYIHENVISILENYQWKGNIRELKNVSAYIDTLCESNEVKIQDLPEYLLSNRIEIFTQEIDILKEKKCLELSNMILEELIKAKVAGKGLGRNTLMDRVNDKGGNYSEGEVKKVLATLFEIGFISSSVGRGGSKINEKGISFMDYIKTKNKGHK